MGRRIPARLSQNDTNAAPAHSQGAGGPAKLTVRIVDDNGVPVPSVLVHVTSASTQQNGETDVSGIVEFGSPGPPPYDIHANKQGFYSLVQQGLKPAANAQQANQEIELTLNHQQEIKESMNVTYAPPAIDPAATAAGQTVTDQQVVNVPYPVSRDIRSAFTLVPGVVKDNSGQFHVDGARTAQTEDQIDGFNVNHPKNGLLKLHVSADSVRAVEISDSGYSVEHGQGSGGLVQLRTGMGDDRFRFSATNFLPSFQNVNGLAFNDFNPRAALGGPLSKGRAWFFDAGDGEYKLKVVKGLPAGGNHDPFWQMSNLAKAQFNISDSNILLASALVNHFHEDHNTLSVLNPVWATVRLTQQAEMGSLRDQAYLPGRVLVDAGFAYTRYHDVASPLGADPFLLTPSGPQGNFFKATDEGFGKTEWQANAVLPGIDWVGHHEIKAGLDLLRSTVGQADTRGPTTILGVDGGIERQILYAGGGKLHLADTAESAYAQDRWSPGRRVVLEIGGRLDRDQVLSGIAASPRLATSVLLTSAGETKLTAGIGTYYDLTDLSFLTPSLDAVRSDVSFGPGRNGPRTSVAVLSFASNPRSLERPRYLDADLGLETRLPGSWFLDLLLMRKRGFDGLAFQNLGPVGGAGNAPAFSQKMERLTANLMSPYTAPAVMGCTGQPACFASGRGLLVPASSPVRSSTLIYELANVAEDRYTAAKITIRRNFGQGYQFVASYTRSRARSTAVIDFNVDNPVLASQSGGPLPWDSPNRLIAWGWAPLVKKFTFAYFMEWRSGYPFSLLDQNQALVGPPDSQRFPNYFSLDTHVERRVTLLGYNLAVRVGFNNVTGRHNPAGVNNNIDSRTFGLFSSADHRVLTARIRLIGRK